MTHKIFDDFLGGGVKFGYRLKIALFAAIHQFGVNNVADKYIGYVILIFISTAFLEQLCLH